MVFTSAIGQSYLRLSVPELAAEASRRSAAASEVFSASPTQLVFSVGSTKRLAMPSGDHDSDLSTNMHLTLIRQHGLVGWVLMLWIFAAALVALYRGYDRIHDPHMRRIVWAIFSSTLGFLASMTDANVFFNVTIQIFIWGMIGVGMGIITHLNGRRPTFRVLWRFGEHGD